MDRTEVLLSKGYFPSQLPPAFITNQLAAQVAALQVRWKISAAGAKAPACKPELFSVARAGHQRRLTSIPNPVPQTFLATFVARHWADFLRHYRKSRLSASHPRFLRAGERAACIPSMQRLHERKILESAGFRYVRFPPVFSQWINNLKIGNYPQLYEDERATSAMLVSAFFSVEEVKTLNAELEACSPEVRGQHLLEYVNGLDNTINAIELPKTPAAQKCAEAQFLSMSDEERQQTTEFTQRFLMPTALMT